MAQSENTEPKPVDAEEKVLTPEEIELKWYHEVYKGDDAPQLTFRAVLMGGVLGGFMSLSNLYVGLKTGWGLGVAITACILSFAVYRILMALFPRMFPTDMTLLENNCMQATASAAGYSTGGTMVSAIAAYLMITGTHMSYFTLTAWTFFLAALGFCMAVPMKRQMINVEQLKFPSGIAAAETLRSLHAAGQEAVDKARALGLAGALGGVIVWCRDAAYPAILAIPSMLPLPGRLLNIPAMKWTFGFEVSAIMIAAGALMGFKTTWSMLLGAAVNYGILAPQMFQIGAIEAVVLNPGSVFAFVLGPWSNAVFHSAPAETMLAVGLPAFTEPFATAWNNVDRGMFANQALFPLFTGMGLTGLTKLGYSAIVRWSTWAGASIMVSSGLLVFLLQWKTVLRAFSGVATLFSGKKAEKEDPLEKIEVPASWFVIGLIFSSIGCMLVMHFAFETSWIMGLVAIFTTFFLAIVACRATGETDITPIGAMGKITQLMFGVLAPGNLVTNLMTAGVTAGAAGASADLLTCLKPGYILGANPRKQFIAMFIGIFFGLLVVVPAFYLLVPTADVLGTDKWPAPSAQVWAAVARLLASGLDALHPTARMGMLFGAILGIILTLADVYAPKSLKPYIPSATGVGLSMVIPFWNSLSMFIGAVITMILEKKAPEWADKYIVPISSGLIAGESLLGVFIAILREGFGVI
jgi:uncharacterized oligopeptide transporter (OPT) family protein